nr:hypothetical protein CFP56_00351 [Quercus suber]
MASSRLDSAGSVHASECTEWMRRLGAVEAKKKLNRGAYWSGDVRTTRPGPAVCSRGWKCPHERADLVGTRSECANHQAPTAENSTDYCIEPQVHVHGQRLHPRPNTTRTLPTVSPVVSRPATVEVTCFEIAPGAHPGISSD